MDLSFAMAISASGMDVERARLDAAAVNLANVHTSRTAQGGAFRPLRVVSTYGPGFSDALAGASRAFPVATPVTVQQPDVPPRLVFEPGHPDADGKGFVAYPGIDTTAEMVGMMTAVRAYEANLMAINAAKAMALRALEIGSGT